MTMVTYVDSQDRGSYTSLTLVIPREGSRSRGSQVLRRRQSERSRLKEKLKPVLGEPPLDCHFRTPLFFIYFVISPTELRK